MATAAPTETTAPVETTEPPTEPPVYISPLAVEDLLLPVEEYSWEREYAAEYVMIHFTSAVTTHRDDPYNMQAIRDIFVEYNISVHYIIGRDGTVYCYVPEDRVAWHAGAGQWLEDEKYTNTMNQYAIGIELAAIGSESDMSIYLTPAEYRALDDSLKGFTDAQYAALQLLVEDICQRNEIPMDRAHVIGHQEYSTRKPDPGMLFDWSKILP
jgi:N-acetyl-anhydromuramyl-L-alanine amidase AmpD